MKVSVCVITYNHEKFIVETIESILNQQTKFDYELVIGEDCSTDRTRAICLQYKEKFPDKIQLILQNENQGMMRNMIQTILSCHGKYIAFCEGDDYWIDPLKLQKQVDFLETNSDYVLCFHNALIQNENNSDSKLFIHSHLKRSTFFGADILKEWLIPSASVVFRNGLIKSFPSFLEQGTHGDLALFLMHAEYGKIKYLDEAMSVYRRHSTGVTNVYKGLQHNLKHIEFCRNLNSYFNFKYDKLFKKRIADYYLSSCIFAIRNKNISDARAYFFSSIRNDWKAILNGKDFLQGVIGILFPSFYLYFYFKFKKTH